MNLEAKITSKGQITIPKKVRSRLGIKPGDFVEFEMNDNETTIRPVRSKFPFAKFRGMGTPGVGSGKKAVINSVRERRGRELLK